MQSRIAGAVVVVVDAPANMAFDGRCVRCWTQEQISFFSDVIASGTLLETERLGRIEGFEHWDAVGVRVVEMTFSVSQTFKGTVPPDGKIVVRYYEAAQAEPLESSIEADGAATQSYLLYLLEEANNRFAPTSGPMDSRMCIRPEDRQGQAEAKTAGITNTPESAATCPPKGPETARSEPGAGH